MPVYLDHNAAQPLTTAAKARMSNALDVIGNPSSVHGYGRAARRIVEDARAAVAATTGAAASGVIFTGSGTEACQLGLRLPGRPRRIAAAIEHSAVLAAPGGSELAPVDADGRVDIAALQALLGADASDAVVAVMLANNETGVIQPIPEIAAAVHAVGALLFVDAAQAYGKLPIDLATLDADAIALSAAKIGGPLGAGAAIFRSGLTPDAILTGGGQEGGARGGSENIVGLAGFGAAAERVPDLIDGQQTIGLLRDRLEAGVRDIAPEIRPVGAAAPRLQNTSALPMPGVLAATQVMAFDLAGFAVSAGAACSSGKVARSHVLDAMGLPADLAACVIRVSLGQSTTADEIDAFVQAWGALYSRQRVQSAKAVQA